MKLVLALLAIVLCGLVFLVGITPASLFASRRCDTGITCSGNTIGSVASRWQRVVVGPDTVSDVAARSDYVDVSDGWMTRISAWAAAMPLPEFSDEALLTAAALGSIVLLFLFIRLARWSFAIVRQRRLDRITHQTLEAYELSRRMKDSAEETDRLIAAYMRDAFDRARN